MAEAVLGERGLTDVDDEVHRAAATAVPTVGATLWDVRLPAKRRGTIAAAARGDRQGDLIKEHSRPC
jgi:hypothetical protein